MTARSKEPMDGEGISSSIPPWEVLKYRDYRLLWGTNMSAQVGQSMRQLVNYYLVYEITGSTIHLGLTGLFQLIPMLVLGLFGGTMADLFDRKKLILLTLFSGFLIAMVLWGLTQSGQIRVWHIFGFVTATSLVGVFGGPARASMLARTVPHANLTNAITINWATGQVTMLVGPLLAGLLIATLGAASGYFVSAIFFLPSIIGCLLIRTSGKTEASFFSLDVPKKRFIPKIFSSALEGARFVGSQRLLMSIFALDIGVTVVSYFRPLLAAFAKDVYKVGPAALGTITAALPTGSVIGAVFILLSNNYPRKGFLILSSTFFYSICLGLFGIASNFWIGTIIVGTLGLFDAVAVTIKHSTVQIVTPDYMRGRASSALLIAGMTANATGTLEVGLVAAYFGPQNAMLLASAVCLIVVGLAWVSMRTLRAYRV